MALETCGGKKLLPLGNVLFVPPGGGTVGRLGRYLSSTLFISWSGGIGMLERLEDDRWLEASPGCGVGRNRLNIPGKLDNCVPGCGGV
jgi:hypothetical protein